MAGTRVGTHMTIDFTPLPMTELRTRPGETLDRVTEKGESFVIERNGRQIACLVPLTVFLPDIAPARIADELEEIQKKTGDLPQTKVNDKMEIEVLIRNAIDSGAYNINVVLPHGYPNSCPRVYADPIDPSAPHRFSDGALCIFGVISSWNPSKHTVSTALDSARLWLKRYELWREIGEWPKPAASDGK